MPACVAWIVHVPAATNVATAPLTVQMLVVVEAKDTVRPELAVAVSVLCVPTVCAPGLPKVMVCVTAVTVSVAPLLVTLPAAFVTVTEYDDPF